MDKNSNIKNILYNINNRKKYLLFFTLLPLIIDIITKYIVKTNMVLYSFIPVIDGLFNIVYVLNPGAAFSFLHDMNESYRQIFFVSITSVAIIVIFYIFLKETTKLNIIGFALILSGAIGNLIDRIFIGKVVDFLDFYYKSYHFPAFNVADSCITIGVALIIINLIFIKDNKNVDNN